MKKGKGKICEVEGILQTVGIGDVVMIEKNKECAVGFVYLLYNKPPVIYLSEKDPLKPISPMGFDRESSFGHYLSDIVSCEIIKKRSDAELEEGLHLRNRLEEFTITNEGLVDVLDPYNELTYHKPKYGKIKDSQGKNIVIVYPELCYDEPKKIISRLKESNMLKELRKNDRIVVSLTGILPRWLDLKQNSGILKSDKELKEEIQWAAYEKSKLQFADSFLISERTPGDNWQSFVGQATGIIFQALPPQAKVEYFRAITLDA